MAAFGYELCCVVFSVVSSIGVGNRGGGEGTKGV